MSKQDHERNKRLNETIADLDHDREQAAFERGRQIRAGHVTRIIAELNDTWKELEHAGFTLLAAKVSTLAKELSNMIERSLAQPAASGPLIIGPDGDHHTQEWFDGYEEARMHFENVPSASTADSWPNLPHDKGCPLFVSVAPRRELLEPDVPSGTPAHEAGDSG